jgi:hypothetical protein
MKNVWETYPTDLLEYPETTFNSAAETSAPEEMEIQSGMFRSAEPFYSPSNKETGILSAPELPINNYLKTKDEIDTEFRFIASSQKIELKEKETSSASYGRIVKMAEAYSYLHSIDHALSAPLEENY